MDVKKFTNYKEFFNLRKARDELGCLCIDCSEDCCTCCVSKTYQKIDDKLKEVRQKVNVTVIEFMFLYKGTKQYFYINDRKINMDELTEEDANKTIKSFVTDSDGFLCFFCF